MIMNKTLKIVNERQIMVQGRNVLFQEFEFDPDGDFAKILTRDHRLGVAAEYEWIKIKYPNYMFVEQKLTHITLNGENIQSDILTIAWNGQIKKIYFDISCFFDQHKRA